MNSRVTELFEDVVVMLGDVANPTPQIYLLGFLHQPNLLNWYSER